MKVNSIAQQNINFNGSFYNNKLLLKGLKYTSENAVLVTTGTTLVMSAIVRPIAILSTPNTAKRDKEYACSKSIASSAVGFGLTALIFNPISKAMNAISSAPSKFLTKKTIKNLSEKGKPIEKSAPFNFIKQTIKLSPEFLAVIPKTLAVCAIIVPLMNVLFNKKKESTITNQNDITFTGSTPKFRKAIINVIEDKKVQEFAKKHKNSNFVQHILSLKDIFATACFAVATAFHPKMEKGDKKSLIYNASIATGLTIIGGYAVNELTKKPAEKFTKNFIKANKNDKNLHKYLNGLKVIKPIIILSALYYLAIPMISTFCADKLSKPQKAS